MSTLKNLELLYAAAYEGISSFEEMSPLGGFKASEGAEEKSSELTCVFAVEAEAALPGDPVFAQVTLAVNANGDWNFRAESGYYELLFETSGALERPKDAAKALDFIEGLKLTHLYVPYEKPSNLEAELAAAYAGYLKSLARGERRGAPVREEKILYSEKLQQSEGELIPEEKRMTMEELMDGLDANDALAKLLRQGPSIP